MSNGLSLDDNRTQEQRCQPPPSSGIVVKFQPNTRNARRRENRDFFEHDTRSIKRKFQQRSRDSSSQSTTMTTTTVLKSFVEKNGGRASMPIMNSKARRAAKYREMRLLQKLMLSKENQLLNGAGGGGVDGILSEAVPTAPTTTVPTGPLPMSCCCHCTCSATAHPKSLLAGAGERRRLQLLAAQGLGQACVVRYFY